MASVKLNKVTKRFGKNEVVKSIDLDINDKEFVVLVGPSGCGKSTTLRMIAGLEEISSGDLFIGDTRVNEYAPKDRDIAMVFQNYALYPHMTVFDNMAFGLKLRKMPKSEIKEKVNNAAKILDIEDLMLRKPNAMSGGQSQRVAIGRAIVRNPKVFLFDEPLSNLDAKLRVQMRIEIARLHKKLNATIVYVTHDQVEAMTLGNRIVVMKDGVIQQNDTPANIYANPVNKFVAGFIGSPPMNFAKGEITAKGNLFEFKDELNILLFKLEKKDFPELEKYINQKITIGFRSENVYEENTNNKFQPFIAESLLTEQMGHEVYLFLKYGNDQITARLSADTKVKIDEEIELFVNTAKLHFFDIETGKVIV